MTVQGKGGRPKKFKSVEDLQGKIDAYFEKCDSRTVEIVTKDGDVVEVRKPAPYTVTGLALALDTTRETLCDYEADPLYSDTIKKAKTRCENYAENQLFEGNNQSGAIFALKNYGWRDKTEQALTGADGGPIEIKGIDIAFIKPGKS